MKKILGIGGLGFFFIGNGNGVKIIKKLPKTLENKGIILRFITNKDNIPTIIESVYY